VAIRVRGMQAQGPAPTSMSGANNWIADAETPIDSNVYISRTNPLEPLSEA